MPIERGARRGLISTGIDLSGSEGTVMENIADRDEVLLIHRKPSGCGTAEVTDLDVLASSLCPDFSPAHLDRRPRPRHSRGFTGKEIRAHIQQAAQQLTAHGTQRQDLPASIILQCQLYFIQPHLFD